MRSQPEFAPSIRPIFIIGAPRSGTSIMTWAIGQHPNIQTMEETNWIATLAIGGFLSHSMGSNRGMRSHLSNSQYPSEPFLRRLGEAADRIVHDCFEERCQRFYGDFRAADQLTLAGEFNPRLPLLSEPSDPKRRWVDGTPLNTHFTWALAQMFPDAMFIHNLRRPDEVATSLEGFDKVGAEPKPLAEGLRIWLQHTEAAALAERAFGASRVFRLRFERISQEPEALFRDLLAFLGEDYHPACLATLDQRLNSSEVTERRQPNAERMLEMPDYLAASSLYWQLQNHRPGESADEESLGVLHSRFVDYCNERTLL